jgi:hypothetical protein
VWLGGYRDSFDRALRTALGMMNVNMFVLQFDGGRTYTEPSVIMTGRPEHGEEVFCMHCSTPAQVLFNSNTCHPLCTSFSDWKARNKGIVRCILHAFFLMSFFLLHWSVQMLFFVTGPGHSDCLLWHVFLVSDCHGCLRMLLALDRLLVERDHCCAGACEGT